jgi:hypothetical protein
MIAINLKRKFRSQISYDRVFGLKLKFAKFMNNGQKWIDPRHIVEHLQAMDLSIDELEIRKVSAFVVKGL